MTSEGFGQSFALFDAAGRLIDWDQGFAQEWLYAAPLLRPGVYYVDLLRAAVSSPLAQQFLTDRYEVKSTEALLAERLANYGKERTRQYTYGDRTIFVHEQPTHQCGMLRIARDITEEKSAESALHAARHQLKAADMEVDSILVEIHRSPSGSYVFPPVTEAMRRFFGLPPDAVNWDPMAVHTRMRVKPEDDARLGALLERSAQTLEVCSIEFPLLDGQDRLRWVRQSMMPRREADGSIVFSGAMRDVTREKVAEDQVELLRSVVVRSGDAILILETGAAAPHETKIVYVNPKFEELYEFDAAEITGQSAAVLQHDDMARASSRALVNALRRGDTAPIDFEAMGRGGRLFRAEARAETVQKLDNGSFRWVVIARDISDRYRQQAELLRAKEAAEAGNRAKSNFLANMSHELRTPLNAILGFTELIKQGLARNGWNENYAEYLDDILESSRHLLALINSVLDLSKIESGSLTLDLDAVDLRALVLNSIELVRGLAESAKITIAADLPPETPTLIGDFVKIKQVLLNILSNAIKFTPENGEVMVAISTTSGFAEIIIADTGCGISEADLERVMQPFMQVENSLSRRFAGSGLGLSIARKLCALHGGHLDIQSCEGEGTTVRIRLPLAQE